MDQTDGDKCNLLFLGIDENDLSWVTQFESEIGVSIESCQFTSSDEPVVKEPKKFDIDTIESIDINSADDITILETQRDTSEFLRNYALYYNRHSLNDTFDDKFFLQKLKWLASSSAHLSKKLHMTRLEHQYTGADNIPRSSYKFCDYGADCEYNYGDKKGRSKGCIAQHFVHNAVNADINILIDYMQNKDRSHSEITKSMNTISYVLGHMANELLSIKLRGGNIKESHKDKRVKKNVKRQKRPQKDR